MQSRIMQCDLNHQPTTICKVPHGMQISSNTVLPIWPSVSGGQTFVFSPGWSWWPAYGYWWSDADTESKNRSPSSSPASAAGSSNDVCAFVSKVRVIRRRCILGVSAGSAQAPRGLGSEPIRQAISNLPRRGVHDFSFRPSVAAGRLSVQP